MPTDFQVISVATNECVREKKRIKDLMAIFIVTSVVFSLWMALQTMFVQHFEVKWAVCPWHLWELLNSAACMKAKFYNKVIVTLSMHINVILVVIL